MNAIFASAAARKAKEERKLKSPLTKYKPYKPVKNDEIEMLWAAHLDKAKINLPVLYISPGNYTYGPKKLSCKIVNGKLLVRISGEYKPADKFIEDHGKDNLMSTIGKSLEEQFNKSGLDGFSRSL